MFRLVLGSFIELISADSFSHLYSIEESEYINFFRWSWVLEPPVSVTALVGLRISRHGKQQNEQYAEWFHVVPRFARYHDDEWPATDLLRPGKCLAAADKLPVGPGWLYEIKLDGYRMIAVRNDKPELYSRLKNSNTRKFPEIATALTSLPHGTVIDGELVAIDNDSRPDFNLLQNYRFTELSII